MLLKAAEDAAKAWLSALSKQENVQFEISLQGKILKNLKIVFPNLCIDRQYGIDSPVYEKTLKEYKLIVLDILTLEDSEKKTVESGSVLAGLQTFILAHFNSILSNHKYDEISFDQFYRYFKKCDEPLASADLSSEEEDDDEETFFSKQKTFDPTKTPPNSRRPSAVDSSVDSAVQP